MTERKKPIFYLLHRVHGPVPAVGTDGDTVIWDSNQWDREVPQNPTYEVSPVSDFLTLVPSKKDFEWAKRMLKDFEDDSELT